MLFPLNNLPSDSRKWGRYVETIINKLSTTIDQNVTNVVALNNLSSSSNNREGYYTPTVFVKAPAQTISAGATVNLGSFNINVLSNGFILTAGFEANASTLTITDYVYLYFKLVDSNGADTRKLTSDTFVRVAPAAITNVYSNSSESIFVSASAGVYTLTVYAIGLTANTYSVKNVFASVQQIKNIN